MFFIALLVCVLTLVGYFLYFKRPTQSVCSNNCNNVKETATVETATAGDKASSSTVATAADEYVVAAQSNEAVSSSSFSTVTGATSDATITPTDASTPKVDNSSSVPTSAPLDTPNSSAVLTSDDSFSSTEVKAETVEACQNKEEETVLTAEQASVLDKTVTAVQDGSVDVPLNSSDATTVHQSTADEEDTSELAPTTCIQQELPPSVVVTQASDVTQEDFESAVTAPDVEGKESLPSQSEPDLVKNADSTSHIHSDPDPIELVCSKIDQEPEIEISQPEHIEPQPETEPILPTEGELIQTEKPDASLDQIQTPATCQASEKCQIESEKCETFDNDLHKSEAPQPQPEVETSPATRNDESSVDKIKSNDVTHLNCNDVTNSNDVTHANGVTNSSPDENLVHHNAANQNGVTALVNNTVTHENVDDIDDICVTPKNDMQNGECWQQSCDSIDEIVETDTFDIHSECRSKPKLKRQETLYECAEVVTFVSRMNICCAIFKNPADHRTHYYRRRFKVPKDEEPIPTELRNIAASFRLWGKMWDRIHHIKICQKSCEVLEQPSRAIRRLDEQREDCQNKFGCKVSLQDFETLGTLEKKVLGDLLDKIHNNFVSDDDLAYFNLQDDSELIDNYYFDL